MWLNWVDWLIIVIIVISSLISLKRGFFKEVLSLLIWVVAIFISWFYSTGLSVVFIDWISVPSLRIALTALIIFVLVLFCGGLINKFFLKLVHFTDLSGTDRCLGMVFGGLRGVALVVLLVWVANYLPIANDDWWKSSILAPHFQLLVDWSKSTILSVMTSYVSG